MLCQHLQSVERAIIARGIRETFRGRAWSDNCREWAYFDCFIDVPAVRRTIELDACVRDHEHRGTHDGQERGLVCSQCHDGLMGRWEPAIGVATFAG